MFLDALRILNLMPIKRFRLSKTESNEPLLSGQVKCKICNVSKYSLKDLKQHYFIEHKHCLDCNITFESHTLGREHTRDIHKMKIKCDQCSYSSYEWSVRFHQKKHQAFSQNKKESFNDSLMPKITSIAGNVIKIVDDDIIAVDPPKAKKMKIEENPKQSNKPGKVSFTSYNYRTRTIITHS